MVVVLPVVNISKSNQQLHLRLLEEQRLIIAYSHRTNMDKYRTSRAGDLQDDRRARN